MADHSYQVLARKWRPQRFDQVVGQPAIVRTLRNALEQGRVAHAYCFSGIRGVGKTTIARLLAKGLNCRNSESPTASPCSECEACVEIEESRSLDVIELDAASQTGVDDIRQLNEFARYTPSRDRYRVFIIDEAHMLSTSAFNALLKTLEEPPPHVVFLLATTEPHKILQTVLSRCQHYPLGRISQVEISSRLREMVDAEQVALSDDALAMVAIAADGSLRDAQSLLDKLIAFGGDDIDDETVVELLGMVDRELLFTATDLLTAQDLAGILGLVNRMVEQGVDLHQFTLDLLGHLRALLVVATVPDAGEILHLPGGDLDRLRGQAERFEIDDLDRAFALLSASEYRIKQSEVPRYELEMVLARLARMPRLEPIATLISQLRSGSGGDTGGGNAGPGSSRDPATNRRSGSGGVGAAPGGAAASAPSTSAPPPASSEAPAGAATRTESTTEAPPEAAPSMSQTTEWAVAESSKTVPTPAIGTDVRLVIERLRADKPMIAQIIERADSVQLRDETLFLTFREAGGIFRARLRDGATVEAIAKAAESALGRKITVVVGFNGDAEGSTELTPATESPRAEASLAPQDTAQQHRDELWRRAEGEPMVQQFVDALRGNLTDVEDM